MALSDLKVYSEYAYSAKTELLDQQLALFNAATGGAFVLRAAATQGDFSEEAFYKAIPGLVRSRNPYGDGAIAQKTLAMSSDTAVKVARGTPEIRMDPHIWQWIQRSPEEAGVVLGQQLAEQAMADMVNTAIGIAVAAIGSQSGLVLDDTTAANGNKPISFIEQTKAVGLMGDRQGSLRTWVMHSGPMTQLYLNALSNVEHLFGWGNTTVARDAQGRLMVITDAPALVTKSTSDTARVAFHSLCLKPGAVMVGEENDWFANEDVKNGSENIVRTYQAQWSVSYGIDGFTWDKDSGGKAPNDAALFAAANWDRTATYLKDLPGVLLKTAA